ncbi:hypothetical protein FACS189423_06800 [Bacteroidia bacterium]|nr:hypothetical protein FACS189423_06800 [Bacteroidia bacterium]
MKETAVAPATYTITATVTGTGGTIAPEGSVTVNAGSNKTIEDVVAGQLKIFPNPVKTELFIKSDWQIQKVEIYTVSGALLLSENNFNEKISVSAFPKGVYLLKVYSGSGVAVSNLVKE